MILPFLSRRLQAVALAVLLCGLAADARAQGTDNLALGALITNTAQTAGLVPSASQVNSGALGVTCTYNQTAHVGSPVTVIAVQFQDSASGVWQSLATSLPVQYDGFPASVMIYPDVATPVGVLNQLAGPPPNFVSVNLKLPRTWRVVEVVSGSASPTVTGTVGCDLLK
jgi:hypothetical protein